MKGSNQKRVTQISHVAMKQRNKVFKAVKLSTTVGCVLLMSVSTFTTCMSPIVSNVSVTFAVLVTAPVKQNPELQCYRTHSTENNSFGVLADCGSGFCFIGAVTSAAKVIFSHIL